MSLKEKIEDRVASNARQRGTVCRVVRLLGFFWRRVGLWRAWKEEREWAKRLSREEHLVEGPGGGVGWRGRTVPDKPPRQDPCPPLFPDTETTEAQPVLCPGESGCDVWPELVIFWLPRGAGKKQGSLMYTQTSSKPQNLLQSMQRRHCLGGSTRYLAELALYMF